MIVVGSIVSITRMEYKAKCVHMKMTRNYTHTHTANTDICPRSFEILNLCGTHAHMGHSANSIQGTVCVSFSLKLTLICLSHYSVVECAYVW